MDPNTQISPGRSCLSFSADYQLISSPGLTQKKPQKIFCSWFKFHTWLHFSFCLQINKKYVDLNTWVSPSRSYSSFNTDSLGWKNAAGKSINTGSWPCPSRYNILRAPKFNYQSFSSLWAPQLTHIIWKKQHLFKGGTTLSSPITYEELYIHELIHVIWTIEGTWAQSASPILHGPLSPSNLPCYMVPSSYCMWLWANVLGMYLL